MIIENFENDLQPQIPQDLDSKIYNPNKSFASKKYFKRFTQQISMKNWTSLIKVHNKIESLLRDDSKIIVSEKLEELYESLDFDQISTKIIRKSCHLIQIEEIHVKK